jgi:hypothetical protein
LLVLMVWFVPNSIVPAPKAINTLNAPASSCPYSPYCVEEEFCELRV